MNRFQNSWLVAKQSWEVLRANPSLAIFPVISGIGAIGASIPFLVPFLYLAIKKPGEMHQCEPAAIALSFLMYTAIYTVIIFCNSALVTCAYQNLRGLPATPSDGIANAVRHLPKIVGWALISATVGQLIRMVQQRGGIIGSIIGGLVGFAWNITIYFVVPLIVIEDLGPVDALKGSAARLKHTWGEQLMLNGGLGLVTGLLIVLPVVALTFASVACFVSNLIGLGIALVGVTVLYTIAGSIISSCLSTIFQTALYVYSSTGVVPGGFSPASITGAFATKPRPFGR